MEASGEVLGAELGPEEGRGSRSPGQCKIQRHAPRFRAPAGCKRDCVPLGAGKADKSDCREGLQDFFPDY